MEVYVGPIGPDPVGIYHLPDPDGAGFGWDRSWGSPRIRGPGRDRLLKSIRGGKVELLLYPQSYPPIREDLCGEKLVRGNFFLDRLGSRGLGLKFVGHAGDGQLYALQSLATVIFYEIEIESLYR